MDIIFILILNIFHVGENIIFDWFGCLCTFNKRFVQQWSLLDKSGENFRENLKEKYEKSFINKERQINCNSIVRGEQQDISHFFRC